MEQEKLTKNQDIISLLCEKFPACFTLEGEFKPLKIGIFRDLSDAFSQDDRVSNRYLRIALRHYTNSWKYLLSVKEGAQRVDLEGNAVEEVSAEHASHAAEQLKESKEKANAARKAKLENQKKPRSNKDKKFKNPSVKLKVTQKKNKFPSQSVRQVNDAELKIGTQVSVKLGKVPMPAEITEVAKDGILVQLNTGMTVKVQADKLRITVKNDEK